MNRLQPELKPCPKCGHLMKPDLPVSEDKRAPEPGDFSMCAKCGTPVKFGPDMRLLELTDEDWATMEPEERDTIKFFKQAWEDARNPEKCDAWTAQIKKMAENAKEWRRRNPGRDAKVQFNYPRHVMVVAPISVAIKKGFVSTDIAGLELIRALWRQDVKTEPTVFMVRMAIELSSSV